MAELSAIDYPTIALSLLIERFKDSEDIQKLLVITAEVAMDLQTAVFEIDELFVLETAEGPELTIIGNVWDVSRKLDVIETDNEYRDKISVKAVLSISGTISEIKKVLYTFFGATYVDYVTQYPAGYAVYSDAVITQIMLNTFTASGVQALLETGFVMGGSVVGISAVSGAANVSFKARGLSASVSTVPFVQGTMTVLRSIEGSADSVSVVEASATIPHEVIGSCDSVSSVSGAADVSGSFEENLIAFATVSTDVSGWNKVDGSDVALDLIGKYPKVHSSEGSTGGSETHDHGTFSGSSGGLSNNKQSGSGENRVIGARSHTHTINHTHPSVNNEPEYLKVLPVTDGDAIKTSMFLFYDGGSAPSGWSALSAAIDKMYKCDLAPEATPTGGNADHSHVHSGSTNAVTPSITTDNSADSSGGNKGVSPGNHSHSNTHTHVGGENYPLWHGLIPVKPDSETGELPSGICAFFKGSVIPDGWSAFSAADGKWIQGKSIAGATGGANTHNHVSTNVTGYRNGEIACNSGGSAYAAAVSSGHRHTMYHTESTVDNIPPYQELMFLKKD